MHQKVGGDMEGNLVMNKKWAKKYARQIRKSQIQPISIDSDASTVKQNDS